MRPLLALITLAACTADSPDTETTTSELSRVIVVGDVVHYDFALRVGSGPNGTLHVHRIVRESSPGRPRRTTNAIMLMHGDFSSFQTNFMPEAAPGMAVWLAQRNIDVWGIDRRWVHAPAGDDADVSDFATMGVTEELDDIGIALAFARAVRAVTSGSADQMVLSGFSRGGMLAYYYASRETTRPLRHVKALVPIDVYASIAPADEELRLFNCELAGFEQEFFDAGFIDGPNSALIEIGQLALSAPNDPAPDPFRPGQTNRGKMLALVGRTYLLGFPATPFYHLIAPTIDGVVTGLRYSPEDVVGHWLAGAAPHQAMLEQAQTDAILCGDHPPIDVPLSAIHVPLLLLAAAGGYGDHAVYSTTQVASTDVTTRVIRRLPVEQEPEDFGHADLLYATDAPALVWQPLLAWLNLH